jgi:glycosyltransferase involved in cell wall biosynthesis
MLILSSIFADDPKLVREGTANRLLGFYGSMANCLLAIDPLSSVYWYSNIEHSFRPIYSQDKKKSSIFASMYRCIRLSSLNKSFLLVIVAYPSVVKDKTVKGRLFSSIDFLLSISAIKLIGYRRAKLVLDDFDPPVELNSAFSPSKPSTVATIFRRTFDIICLKLASEIVVVTDSYLHYFSKFYKIDSKKFSVIPNGALIDQIPCAAPKFSHPITVLYSGSATKPKNFDKLLDCIFNLRLKGLDIELQVAGSEIDLPEWTHNIQTDWKNYVKNVLTKADICVIPYPPNKLHFAYTLPAKLADYMAAGKPIVATNALETALLVKKYDCGLIAENWTDFSEKIERLCCCPDLAVHLGNNGRKAIEENYSYELLAESFLKKMSEKFS